MRLNRQGMDVFGHNKECTRGKIVKWLLLIYFRGHTNLIQMERFETEAYCHAAALAAVQMYNEPLITNSNVPWRCIDLGAD